MYLGGTGSTTDTVTSGTSSKKDDDISRIRILTNNCTSWSSTHNCTDLHTFCNVVRMIDFFYIAGSKTDLVTVGAVAVSCTTNQFLLRKLALQSLFYGNSRICCSCYTHCLIYISTSGKRVTDCTAKAGSCATKWLDFCRMVVCLILKVDQPFLFFSIYINRHYNTAGIDLVGLFLILKLAFGFQFLHSHKSKIHQADEFVVSSLIKDFSVGKISVIGINDRSFIITLIKFHLCKLSGECSMTAMVRPVSIQNTNLGHGRITFLLVLEIVLDMKEILECHSKVQGAVKFLQWCFIHIAEAIENLNIFRVLELCNQCLRLLKTCLTGIYRVNAVILDCLEFFLCNVTFDHISSGRTDDWLCIFVQELHALYSGICSLVKLARKEFYRKNMCAICCLEFLQVKIIYRRLGKYGMACFLKYIIRNILYVIADQFPHVCYSLNAQIRADLMLQFFGFYGKGWFLFYVYSSYVTHWKTPFVNVKS